MQRFSRQRASISGIICVAVAVLGGPAAANAQEHGTKGKQVVEQVCAECHETGVNDAPKIGDDEAWKERVSQGLSALTQHALDGIRQMPAHGGQPGLTDLEIAQAITYMVNASGGDWIEPKSDSDLMEERAGRAVVENVCSQCHREGKDGAPRIGDRDAWAKRLRQGLPHAVQSAIRGHGGMPPRGGAADLTDEEIRNAIVYMLNPAAAAESASVGDSPEAQPASSTTNHATVGGMDIYLGFVSAEKLRSYPEGSVERSMHGGVPTGDDWYHVNVSLLDAASHAPIDDAQVNVRIGEVKTTAAETNTLEPMAFGGSYGSYFRMESKLPYHVTVRVRSTGRAPVEAEFQYQHE